MYSTSSKQNVIKLVLRNVLICICGNLGDDPHL